MIGDKVQPNVTDRADQPNVTDRAEQAKQEQAGQQALQSQASAADQPDRRVAPGRRPLFRS